jgi:hypothetical protein
MENLLLVVDVEGCIGVFDLDNYEDYRKKVETEVSYIIECIHQLGNYEVTLLDCHDDGTTLLDYAKKNGINHVQHLWSLKDAYNYSKALLIGFHSKNGAGGIISHTLRPDINKLYIGNKDVGELFFIINWLSYYKIPVIYVSGDETLERELKNELGNDFNGVFCKVKTISSLEILPLINIKNALSKYLSLLPICYKYDENKLKIELTAECFSKLIPDEICTVNNNYLLFKDTMSFVNNLQDLCFYINLSSAHHHKRVKSVSKLIRAKYESVEEIKDNDVKTVLSKTWQDLSDADIKFLYEKLLKED